MTHLGQLPVKVSKRLWANPSEFLLLTHALRISKWALAFYQDFRASLPETSRAGPKAVYADHSIMLMALIHVAWQMSYEEVVDYFRAHPEATQAAGFPSGRVISVGQYWQRRRALGILPFWLFFLGMVWQLSRMGVIWCMDVFLDSTTLAAWFQDDFDAYWTVPNPKKRPRR